MGVRAYPDLDKAQLLRVRPFEAEGAVDMLAALDRQDEPRFPHRGQDALQYGLGGVSSAVRLKMLNLPWVT